MILRSTTLMLLLSLGCVPDALPDPMPANHPASTASTESPPKAPATPLDLEAAAAADRVLPPVKRAGGGDKHHGHSGMKGGAK